MQAQLLFENKLAIEVKLNAKPRLIVGQWKDTLQNAITNFLASIDANSVFAPAWGGLGISLTFFDPILAQHCLARSIELDKSGAGKNFVIYFLIYCNLSLTSQNDFARYLG